MKGQCTLEGKNVLVTGASRGIGKAIARKLAQHGANIIINYFNSETAAQDLAAELEKEYSTQTLCLKANVASKESVTEMFNAIKTHCNHLDILVSNAASGVLKPILEMSSKHFNHCMQTNAVALTNLTQAAVNMMREGSRILALSSLGSKHVLPDYGYVGASKAALEVIIRQLSVELASKKIHCNTVSAGAVDTDALKYFPDRDHLLKQSQDRSLTGSNITPQDVANVIYLLCLPEADMIRGQTIYVDAGASLMV